jgi:hypothetical protein
LRFRALQLAGRSPSGESLNLAESLVIRDPAPTIRRLCFRQLFVSGRRGWLRPFLSDAKRQGWSLDLIRVLKASPRCTIPRFRKLIRHHFESHTETGELTKTLTVWSEVDKPGAGEMARREYDRHVVPPSTKDLEFRQFCLRRGAGDDPQWATPRTMREVLLPNGITRIGAIPLKVLPDKERGIVVKELMPEFAKRGQPLNTEAVRRVAELAPVVAAECLLRVIFESAHESADSEEQRRLRQTLHEISHATVVRAVLHSDFAEPSPLELVPLLRALSVGFPGGDPDAVQSLPEEILSAYRDRLLHWLSLLPPLDRNSAFDWAILATLIGEVGHPDDAELLYRFLREDESRVLEQIDKRRVEVEAYECSGRTTTPPGPIDWMPYGNWHIAALANVPGKGCMESMLELLADRDHIGIAAHTIARDAGADPIDVSGSIHSNPRFDLVYEKRSARKPLGELASQYEAAIKRAIDLHLTHHRDNRSPALFSGLCGLARIAGPDSESWILERLERHFTTQGAEGLLEYITLAGGLLPGQRILPFIRNTIAFAQQWSQHDQTYLVTKALVSLFFSDAPELAIQLLEGDASWFLKSYQFRSLLGMLIWERSAVVDAWLERLLGRELEPYTRDAILECLAQRGWKRGDRAAVLDVAKRLAEAGTCIDPIGSARRIIGEIGSADEAFRSQLLARARAAQSANEAAGWLNFISEIGTHDGMRVAFKLADRFGEQLGIVSSLAPHTQQGMSLSFQGWYYFGRGERLGRVPYHLPDIIAKLHEFTVSADPAMCVAAERALLWIERERILAGSPPSGPRTVPPHVGGRPWHYRPAQSTLKDLNFSPEHL